MSDAHSYEQLVDSLSPELYRRLLAAVETGKWPDGRPLTEQQREHTLQAVIAWGERHLPPEQRVGFLDRGHKAQSAQSANSAGASSGEQPLRWSQDSAGASDERAAAGQGGAAAAGER